MAARKGVTSQQLRAQRSGAVPKVQSLVSNIRKSDCPLFLSSRNKAQGELLPGKSDKDGKRKGTRGSQEYDSGGESSEKICLFCTQLKCVADWVLKITRCKIVDISSSSASKADSRRWTGLGELVSKRQSVKPAVGFPKIFYRSETTFTNANPVF